MKPEVSKEELRYVGDHEGIYIHKDIKVKKMWREERYLFVVTDESGGLFLNTFGKIGLGPYELISRNKYGLIGRLLQKLGLNYFVK